MDATLLSTDGEWPSHNILKRFFAQCGFRVEVAHDRLEWLTKARSLAPEVLVIDLDASWGGDAAVRALRTGMRGGFAVPAVFVIGNAPPDALARRTGVPGPFCFQKPVAMDSLLDRIGLTVAMIDLLRKTGQPRPRRRPPNQPTNRELCLV